MIHVVVYAAKMLIDTWWCSVVGGCVIAFGFYSVIWGQAQEEKKFDDKVMHYSSEVPLLRGEP